MNIFFGLHYSAVCELKWSECAKGVESIVRRGIPKRTMGKAFNGKGDIQPQLCKIEMQRKCLFSILRV